MEGRTIPTIALLTIATAWPLAASTQPLSHGRGNILSIDYRKRTVALRDPKNNVATWRFRIDVTVKFTDGAPFFPNPSFHDLRPPMYVHFMARNDVIETFDVRELGFDPADPTGAAGGAPRQPGVSRTVTGRVIAYDASARQAEIEHHGIRETFQLTARSNVRLQAGQRVRLRTDWSEQREFVSELWILDDDGTDGDDDSVEDRAKRRHGRSRE